MKGHHAVIVPGESIALFGTTRKRVSTATEFHGFTTEHYERRFRIGDLAEYHAFNLSYYGPIVSIGEKTIAIRESHGSRVHRLDIATFSRRNRDFDVEKAWKRNSEWSD